MILQLINMVGNHNGITFIYTDQTPIKCTVQVWAQCYSIGNLIVMRNCERHDMARINKVVLKGRPHPHTCHRTGVLIKLRDIAFEQTGSDVSVLRTTCLICR